MVAKGVRGTESPKSHSTRKRRGTDWTWGISFPNFGRGSPARGGRRSRLRAPAFRRAARREGKQPPPQAEVGDACRFEPWPPMPDRYKERC
jgi:hypothetical protein